jgi:hypothetical protein
MEKCKEILEGDPQGVNRLLIVALLPKRKRAVKAKAAKA